MSRMADLEHTIAKHYPQRDTTDFVITGEGKLAPTVVKGHFKDDGADILILLDDYYGDRVFEEIAPPTEPQDGSGA